MPLIRPSTVETADAASGVSTLYNLAIGTSGQGTINTNGDHDWFRLTLTSGQTYTFAEIGTGRKSLQDTYLQLRDVYGNVVASDDDGGPGSSSLVTFTATASGTYYLDVGAYGDQSSGQYGISASLGTHANFDVLMGAGAVDSYATWNNGAGTPITITYAFRQSAASYSSSSNISTFTQCTSAEMTAVNGILQLWSDVCGVTFVNANPGGYSNNATILIGNYSDPSDGAGAFAYYPGSTASSSASGDLWLNLAGGINPSSILPGSYSFMAIIHELGHALGLSHPGDYNAGPGVSITYANSAQFVQDTQQYSIMSYFAGSNTGESPGRFGTAFTPLMFDIYELQQFYGANTTTRVGDTTYGFGSNAGYIYDFSSNPTANVCIWDAGGNDTLNCSGFSQTQNINLNEATFSSIGGQTNNLSIALGVVIENAIGGSGNDTIIGNTADNYLFGGNGNDDLYGLSGHNTLDGGAGFDRAFYDGAFSSFALSFPGLGQVQVSATGIADTLTSIEQLVFNDRLYDVPVSQSVSLDSGNQFAWNTSTTRFDWQGKAIDITLSNDDGTITSFSYDTLSQFAWTKVVSYLDTSHRTYLTVYTNDDGTSVNYQYNTDGTHSWSSVQANYNAQGQTSVTYNNNDLTTITYQFDLSHTQTWSSLITDYDSQMRTQTISYHQDDGTLVVYQYDNASSQTWSSLVTTYDSQQNVQSVIYNNDDGGAVVYQYDTAHTYNWTDIATYFATGMVKDHDVYDLDNGGHVYHQYDPSSGTIAKTLVYDANWALIA